MNREDILKNIIECIDKYSEHNNNIIKESGYEGTDLIRKAKDLMYNLFLLDENSEKIDYHRSDIKFINSLFKVNMAELLLSQVLCEEIKEYMNDEENSFCAEYDGNGNLLELRIKEKEPITNKIIYHYYTFEIPSVAHIGEARFEQKYYSVSCYDYEKETQTREYL